MGISTSKNCSDICQSYINEKSCRTFINKNSCNIFNNNKTNSFTIDEHNSVAQKNISNNSTNKPTLESCSSFINDITCDSFINDITCDPFITKNKCSKFITPPTYDICKSLYGLEINDEKINKSGLTNQTASNYSVQMNSFDIFHDQTTNSAEDEHSFEQTSNLEIKNKNNDDNTSTNNFSSNNFLTNNLDDNADTANTTDATDNLFTNDQTDILFDG